MKKIIIFIQILFVVQFAYTQQQNTDSLDILKIQAKAAFMGDSVIIRWAPTDPEAWIIGMNNGFILERIELDSNYENISNWKTLSDTLKPFSIEKWKRIFSKDSSDIYAMMAAESLYGKYQGKSKEIKPKSIAEYMLEAQDFEERFTICLISADLSALGATGMAWRWCDKDIEKNKKYLYNIYCPFTDTSQVILQNSVIEVNTDFEYNPIPEITKVEEKEKQVDLLLDRDYHTKNFTAFYFEKSTDGGKTFFKLNDSPYFNPLVEDKNIGNKDFITFIDTFSENYIPAQYRVAGITPFATKSPFSPVITAMGRDKTPPPAPDSIRAMMLKNGTMKIDWVYNNPVDDLNGFIIGRSDKPYKDFSLLFEKPIPGTSRSYIDSFPKTLSPNYYTILAIDTAGNASMARAVYGNYIDSIPPAAPIGLTGNIDTNGIVTLKWNMGKEQDLIGYHVYFNNQADHFWTNVSQVIVQDTVFIDTITLKSLTEKIFYRITALDYNYNVSKFSDILELQKPDLVPPAPPTLVEWKATENSIVLKYNKSHSKDIMYYKLLRKNAKGLWDTLYTYTVEDIPQKLQDYNLQPNSHYTYALIAIDDAGNSSGISYKLSAKTRRILPKGSIDSFNVSKTGEYLLLTWKYTGRDSDRILIFRAENNKKVKFIKNVKANSLKYLDKNIDPEKSYKYRILAESAKGLDLDYSEVKFN